MREDLHGDVYRLRYREEVWSSNNPSIRVATDADKEFMLALAQECYPNRGIERGRGWMEWCMTSPARLVLVGPASMGVAEVYWRYGFEHRARLTLLAARPGSGLEPLRMLRMMVAWARQRGAKGFRIDSDTGVDFGPFARRLGGWFVETKCYEIPIGEN